MAKTLVNPNKDLDPTASEAKKIDSAIDNLLKEMGKVIH